jgi:hypothetical protein
MGLSYEDIYDVVSTNNSSTAAINAGASFIGAADDVSQMSSAIVTLFANQNTTLVVQQSRDGTNWDVSDTFSIPASSGRSFCVSAVSQFLRVSVTNTAGSTATTVRLQTIYSTTPQEIVRATGQQASAESLPVVLATDQSAIDVNVLSTPSPSPEDSGFAFGQIQLAAIAEVLLRKATYTEQTANAQRSVVSSSANDSSAGTGVRTVKITYFTATGTGPFEETITLNGTTAVNTVATNICFIDKMEAVTAGSGGVAAGNITVRSVTGGGGVAIKQISTGDLQSFDAVHYVATGQTLYVTGLSTGHNGTTVGSGARYRIRSQPINVANAPLRQVSDFVRLYGQSSTITRIYQSPIIVVGPAKVELWVLPETATSTIYYGSFDYFTR